MGTGKEAVAGIGRRRRFSAEFKRGVVEETLVRGASVASIALRHGLNANQVFNWRRKYLRALAPAAARMLPVKIEAATTVVPVASSSATINPKPIRGARSGGSIEIEYAQARVLIRGAVDSEALRVVLEAFSGR